MQKLKSARACLWFALILLLVGSTIGDPTASFVIMVLAAISALVTVALGGKWSKLIGLLVLIISIFLGQAFWSAARDHQRQYLERAKNAAATNHALEKTGAKP